MSGRASASLSYCAALVRDQSPGRYVATLFAPAGIRPALFGLYAFDHEIAKVRHVVSEPMAGLIRFQWWRDTLDAIAAGRPAPAHPVAQSLQQAWGRIEPSRPSLELAIDARERELEQAAPETVAALEQHLTATSSGPVLVALDLLGVRDQRARDAGRRVGLAIGLADLLREIDLSRRRAAFLPQELLGRHGLAPAALQEATSPTAFAPAIGELAGQAREHLREARRLRRRVPGRALPALLPGVLVGRQLRALHALGAAGGGRAQLGLAPLWLLGYRLLGLF
ncbi:MAG TPA: squalene/phytoene synthase family protein [Geminicoccaceae bacterium]|nr:squalene/phytoene synthase family protein [Geminicoccaceae bacterium]